MMGRIVAHYDGIKAFSETDFTEDLNTVDIPVLLLHGEDEQIVPIENSATKSVVIHISALNELQLTTGS